MFDIIAFDADDTLWENEIIYRRAKTKFKQLMTTYQPADYIERRLDEIEVGNIPYYGYGIKSFTLSMLQAAVELTDGSLAGEQVKRTSLSHRLSPRWRCVAPTSGGGPFKGSLVYSWYTTAGSRCVTGTAARAPRRIAEGAAAPSSLTRLKREPTSTLRRDVPGFHASGPLQR